MVQPKPESKAADEVDQNLKRVFQPTLEEELPDRFKNLLDQLRGGSDSSDTSGQNAEGEE